MDFVATKIAHRQGDDFGQLGRAAPAEPLNPVDPQDLDRQSGPHGPPGGWARLTITRQRKGTRWGEALLRRCTRLILNTLIVKTARTARPSIPKKSSRDGAPSA